MVQQVVSDEKKLLAIQGELGSNSHAAALEAMRQRGQPEPQILACAHSADVFEALDSGRVEMALLPIENSLHGSVAEHYDLLLHHDVAIVGELQMRIRHNVIDLYADHAENYTRFYILQGGAPAAIMSANKFSLAFTVEHRPGTLLAALESFRSAGLNLTRIESRPVHGSPWEYVFFVDLRFEDPAALEAALATLRANCQMVKELGRYPAA